MSRLNSYYKEGFYLPPPTPVHKLKKSFVLYDNLNRHSLFGNSFKQRNRIRSLAGSEPSLAANASYPTSTNGTPLNQGFYTFNQPLTNNPYSVGSDFEYVNRMSHPEEHRMKFEGNSFDNESVLSYCEIPRCVDNRSCQRFQHKGRTRKRYSFEEAIGSNAVPFEFLSPMQETDFPKTYNNRYLQMENYEPDHYGRNLAAYYSADDHAQNWQQFSYNPRLLTSPSPLDSGLSSQSASSPSFEIERNEFYSRSARDPVCLCPGCPERRAKQRPSSGRISPGGRSTLSGFIPIPRRTIKTSHIPSAAFVTENSPQSSQIRYGKLGLIGESNYSGETIGPHASSHQKETTHYNDTGESDTPPKKPHRRKSPKSTPKPFVLLVESPSENELSPKSHRLCSPELTQSDGPESPMSVTGSTSASETMSSSSNEADHPRKSCKLTERKNGGLNGAYDQSNVNDQDLLDMSEVSRGVRSGLQFKKLAEREIRELEDMYEKCNLGDKDLLDRAERRDLPIAHQLGSRRLTRSHSDTLYEVMSPIFHNPYEFRQRAPPSRRSGMPDRIADDMALRKLQRPSSRSSNSSSRSRPVSYMLCSSHFTPTVPGHKDILMMGHPDVELDDLSYRKHYFGKKSKIPDPQPPFGIPLRPPPPSTVFTDYLHLEASACGLQNLCHPRRNPDVIRDDMAFRTLRKDEPERLYYDIAQMYRK